MKMEMASMTGTIIALWWPIHLSWIQMGTVEVMPVMA
jgi:hypothetical protein